MRSTYFLLFDIDAADASVLGVGWGSGGQVRAGVVLAALPA